MCKFILPMWAWVFYKWDDAACTVQQLAFVLSDMSWTLCMSARVT